MSDKSIRVHLSALTDDYQKSMDAAGDSTKAFENRVSELAGRMVQPIKAIGGMLIGIGVAAGKGMGSSIAAGGQFEATMNQVRAVTGTTGASFDMMSDQARQLGSTTRYSATEAGDAMYFLSSAGFGVSEVMSSLPGVLELAAAANMELAEAADIASNVLSGYGMEAAELGHVNDVLAVTFTNTNTNIAQVGEAMSYVAPVARMAGIEFEEAAAAVGLLSNAGIQGSQAGTTLRMILSSLISPSGEAAEALERLSVDTEDATGQMLPLVEILDQFAMSGIGAADIATIFGERAGPGMAALLSQGSDALRNQTVAGLESAGTAAEIAEIQMEGFEGAMYELRSGLEGMKLAMWESGLGSAVTSLVEGLGHVLNVLQDLPEWMQNLAGRLAMLAAVVSAGTGVFLLFGAQMVATKIIMMKLTGNSVLGWAAIGFGKLRAGVMGATTSLLGYNRAVATAATTTKIFKASLGPIGALLAIGAAAFAGFAIANHNAKERIREMRAEIEGLIPEFDTLTEAVQQAALNELLGDDYREFINVMDQMGVSVDTVVAAVTGEEVAISQVNGALDDYYAHLLDTGVAHQAAAPMVNRLGRAFNELTGDLETSSAEIRESGIIAAEVEGRYYDMGHAIEQVGDSSLGVMLYGAQETGDAMRALADETGLSLDQLRELGVTSDMTADEVLELAAASNELADDLTEAEQAAIEAEEAIANYLDTVRRSVDPVYNLLSAVRDADEAQSEYNDTLDEYGENSPEAEAAAWDLVQAVMAAEGAALDADLSFEDFERQLDSWVRQGIIPADAAVAILEGDVEGLRDESERYAGTYEAEYDTIIDGRSRAEALALLDATGEARVAPFTPDVMSAERQRVESVLNNMARTRTVNFRVHTSGATIGGGMAGSLQHDGGWAGTGPIKRYHNGGLAGDEIPAVLQSGEYVLSRQMIANMGGAAQVEAMAQLAARTPTWDSKPTSVSASALPSASRSEPSLHQEINQTINGEPTRETMSEARHQARLAMMEAR